MNEVIVSLQQKLENMSWVNAEKFIQTLATQRRCLTCYIILLARML